MKISELTELTELKDEDVLAGVDVSANETKKVTLNSLKEFILGDIDDLLDSINGEVI